MKQSRARPVFLGLALCLSFLLAACGDDDPARDGDGGGPDGGSATCGEVPALEVGDPDGHAEPLGAGAGEARAGRIEAAELPADPNGLAVWEEGDFLLANDRVAVLIEDAGPSDGYDPYGGKIIGMFSVADGALVDPADFNEVTTAIGRFTIEPTSVTVMNDGSDGGAAVVRALGELTTVPFIDPLVGGLIPGDFGGLPVAIDYTLEPDAEVVDITYTFSSTDPVPQQVSQPMHFFVQYSRMPAWTPVRGFDIGVDMGPVPYVAFVEDGATSYAWQSPDGDLELSLEISGTQLYLAPPFAIDPCGISQHHFARVHIGGPGLDGVLAARARTDGEALRELTVTVREPDGSPAAGVRVHATSGEQHLTRATTDDAGEATLSVPADADIEVTAYRRGSELAGPASVSASETTAELSMPEGGFIHVVATDAASAEGLPVRVMVEPDGGPPEVPRTFGERRERGSRLDVEYPLDGEVTLRVPAGDHRVLVSRGYEYELVTEDVTVAAGETVEVTASMERVVDTTDVMCGDFHIHTFRSPDADDDARFKLASAAGDGLEIPLRSDHEWIYEWDSIISDMGLEQWQYGVTSLELTTFSWGHFGVFPLDPQPSMLNDGAFNWYYKDPPEVFADVRSRDGEFGQPVLIINHPRSFGGFGGVGSYFDAAGYDEATGMVDHPEYWDEEFELVEVFNDSDFDDNYAPEDASVHTNVEDWFSFLNSGRRVFAVGSSDSHHVRSSPVGYPRTCVRLGTDSPAELRAMGAGYLRDVMLDGAITVSGGIYVDAVAAGGVGPGGTVEGASTTELVTVTVQAASWISADTLRVFVDGALTETITLDDTTADPLNPVVRFRDDISVDVADGAAGSWVVFVASGPDDLSPVHPGRDPFGVTNPIFFSR